MSRKRHKPEEIVAKLRQVDVLLAQGHTVADAIRSIGVTEVDRDRELASALQHRSPTRLSGLPPARAGGVRAGACRAAGYATLASSAGRAPASAKANLELTFKPDHPVGADHRHELSHRSSPM